MTGNPAPISYNGIIRWIECDFPGWCEELERVISSAKRAEVCFIFHSVMIPHLIIVHICFPRMGISHNSGSRYPKLMAKMEIIYYLLRASKRERKKKIAENMPKRLEVDSRKRSLKKLFSFVSPSRLSANFSCNLLFATDFFSSWRFLWVIFSKGI